MAMGTMITGWYEEYDRWRRRLPRRRQWRRWRRWRRCDMMTMVSLAKGGNKRMLIVAVAAAVVVVVLQIVISMLQYWLVSWRQDDRSATIITYRMSVFSQLTEWWQIWKTTTSMAVGNGGGRWCEGRWVTDDDGEEVMLANYGTVEEVEDR